MASNVFLAEQLEIPLLTDQGRRLFVEEVADLADAQREELAAGLQWGRLCGSLKDLVGTAHRDF